MRIGKARDLDITRGLIGIAGNTMEQRCIPAKETGVHRKVCRILAISDARFNEINSHIPRFLDPRAGWAGWKTNRSVQAWHHIIDPRSQEHIIRLPHNMLTSFHAVASKPCEVGGDPGEASQQRS